MYAMRLCGEDNDWTEISWEEKHIDSPDDPLGQKG